MQCFLIVVYVGLFEGLSGTSCDDESYWLWSWVRDSGPWASWQRIRALRNDWWVSVVAPDLSAHSQQVLGGVATMCLTSTFAIVLHLHPGAIRAVPILQIIADRMSRIGDNTQGYSPYAGRKDSYISHINTIGDYSTTHNNPMYTFQPGNSKRLSILPHHNVSTGTHQHGKFPKLTIGS